MAVKIQHNGQQNELHYRNKTSFQKTIKIVCTKYDADITVSYINLRNLKKSTRNVTIQHVIRVYPDQLDIDCQKNGVKRETL